MEKKDYSQHQKQDLGNALFRWILLLVIFMAAKVLHKDDIMLIYRLVMESCGHSKEVDQFHGQVIQMMDAQKKAEEEEKEDENSGD